MAIFTKILMLFTITGCAAALIPYTSEPDKMIANSYALIDLGRSLPAKKIITEALEKWQEEKNELGTAKAYTAFGDLYYNGKTQGDFTLPNYPLAKENYSKAIVIYKKNKKNHLLSLNYWGLGTSQYFSQERKKGCKNLYKSNRIYKKWLKESASNKDTTLYNKITRKKYLKLYACKQFVKSKK